MQTTADGFLSIAVENKVYQIDYDQNTVSSIVPSGMRSQQIRMGQRWDGSDTKSYIGVGMLHLCKASRLTQLLCRYLVAHLHLERLG